MSDAVWLLGGYVVGSVLGLWVADLYLSGTIRRLSKRKKKHAKSSREVWTEYEKVQSNLYLLMLNEQRLIKGEQE